MGQQADHPDSGAVQHHLLRCDGRYLIDTPLEQIYRHLLLVEQIRQTGNLHLQLERYHESGLNRLTIGCAEYDPRLLLERISSYLGREAIDIQGAYLDSFCGPYGDITLLSFIVNQRGDLIREGNEQWCRTAFDLRRLPYLDERVFALAEQVTKGDLLAAELLLALSHLAHQKLVRKDALLYSRDRINDNLIRYPQLAVAVTDCFRRRRGGK